MKAERKSRAKGQSPFLINRTLIWFRVDMSSAKIAHLPDSLAASRDHVTCPSQRFKYKLLSRASWKGFQRKSETVGISVGPFHPSLFFLSGIRM